MGCIACTAGGGWLYDLWAVVYDLASASMILFALSGIYLWHQRRPGSFLKIGNGFPILK